MKRTFTAILILSAYWCPAQQQIDIDAEAFAVQEIHDEVLLHGQCYRWLLDMCTRIGPRLSGSPQAAAAVEYTRQLLDTLGLDSVWLQPCVVPRWDRGEKEECRIVNSRQIGTTALKCIALGNSVGTGPAGITAEVVEVMSLDDLRAMPEEDVAGKIVFFNRPMDVTLLNTFRAYGRAVDQRGLGPAVAAGKGAVAAVVRSMSTEKDDIPHTGSTSYNPDGPNIPAVALSTNDADKLSALMERETISLFIRTDSRMLEPVVSHNVIGQIDGSERPDEIILVGGHLDSWDVGHGAHDDGAGCVQSIEVMRTLKAMDYQPRRTIRCVLFMNEENGLAGGTTYAEVSDAAGEFHLAAIESDAGGFVPRGFGYSADQNVQEAYAQSVAAWWGVFAESGLFIQPGGGGADINPLKSQGGLLFGLRPDSQRYFKYHHTAADVIDTVNPRELKLGAAAMTSLVYMLDKYLERQN